MTYVYSDPGCGFSAQAPGCESVACLRERAEQATAHGWTDAAAVLHARADAAFDLLVEDMYADLARALTVTRTRETA